MLDSFSFMVAGPTPKLVVGTVVSPVLPRSPPAPGAVKRPRGRPRGSVTVRKDSEKKTPYRRRPLVERNQIDDFNRMGRIVSPGTGQTLGKRLRETDDEREIGRSKPKRSKTGGLEELLGELRERWNPKGDMTKEKADGLIHYYDCMAKRKAVEIMDMFDELPPGLRDDPNFAGFTDKNMSAMERVEEVVPEPFDGYDPFGSGALSMEWTMPWELGGQAWVDPPPSEGYVLGDDLGDEVGGDWDALLENTSFSMSLCT
jgi:hypothetical protein